VAPRVLLVVSGGIAAYKAPALVRALVATGASVQVIMTPAAAAFVTELSLATVSGRPVRTSLLDPAHEGAVGHIELADWPDLVLVAPATANIMARATVGMADDLATTVLLATRAPVHWAPAMNTNMWRHPATQENLARLKARGHTVIGPDSGALACGWVGEGRMLDPELLAEHVATALADEAPRAGEGEDAENAGPTSWRGRRVLVSAGPTRAHLDPVRFLTNASTGAMGFELAAAAANRGAHVTLVAGPVHLATPPGVERRDVTTADEMLAVMDAVLVEHPQDLVAMVAAVSDLVAAVPSPDKLPKAELETMLASSPWRQGVDVLATLVGRHRDHAYFLGFGAQTLPETTSDPAAVTAGLRALGESKLAKKGCDALFVNRVGVPDTGFGSHTNTGLLLRTSQAGVAMDDAGPPVPKSALAAWILDQLRPSLA